jgi:amidase
MLKKSSRRSPHIGTQPVPRRAFLSAAVAAGASAFHGFTMPVAAQSPPSDLTELSASSLSAAIRARKVSCSEVMQAYLARIHRYNSVYNAIVSMLDDGELMRRAAEADRELEQGRYRGWMHGMPHAVKDLANAQGFPTVKGSPLLTGPAADADDLFVARIRSAGAIFLGKTNTPEFGYGSQSYNPVFGPVRNAYDPRLTAGGSSGGAAVGLATHMLPSADGSDMMGSLRNPAAFNNVIGFRPSQGRIPRNPASDMFYQQLATAGPMGRNVEDTIRLLHSIAGPDPRYALSRTDEIPGYEAFRPRNLKGFKIGWLGNYDRYLPMEPGVLDVCEKNLKQLAGQGVIVEPCRPQYDMARLWQTWLTLRHWSARWVKEYYDDPAKRRQLKPEVVWEYEGGLGMTAEQLYEAGAARSEWYAALQALLEQYDVLALPSAQVFPFPVEVHWPKSINGKPMDTYHRWMEVVISGTLSGLPVAGLPAGFNNRGLPMGMQFLGSMGEDKALLEFAMAYEAATEHQKRKPELRESL